MQFIILAIDIHNPVATYIDNAEFTTLKEVLSLKRIDGLQLHHLSHRHDASENKAIVHGISKIHLILLHHFRHNEMRAQLVGGIMFEIVRMHATEHAVGCLSRC